MNNNFEEEEEEGAVYGDDPEIIEIEANLASPEADPYSSEEYDKDEEEEEE